MAGRPKYRKLDELITKCVEFKSRIVLENGGLPKKSNKVWYDISSAIAFEKSPDAIYTMVHKNYNDIWNHLGYSVFEENATHFEDWDSDMSEESMCSSSYIDSPDNICNANVAQRKFSLTLMYPEYAKMKPSQKVYRRGDNNSSRNEVAFKSGTWTNIIMSHFQKATQLPCTLVFKRSKIARTENALYYARFSATCKECKSSLKGIIRDAPLPYTDVSIECEYLGPFNNKHTGAKRPLSGTRRQEVSSRLIAEHIPASVYRQQQAHETMVYGDPEPNQLATSGVLRVAMHEQRKKSRLDTDAVSSLVKAMDISPYQGVIRDVGVRRFFVHYWSPIQVHVYRAYCQANQGSSQISIDATGGVARRISYQGGEKSGNLFLYEITVRDPKTSMQFSVCNMISDRHDANSISYWLTEWKRSGACTPSEVVTDMSPALMSAVVSSFTEHKTTADYLEACSKMLAPNPGSLNVPACFIRSDVAHTVKLIASWKSLREVIRRTRHFYIRAMCQVLQCTDITDVENLLSAIFIVAQSETEGQDVVTGQPTMCNVKKKMLQSRISVGVDNIVPDDCAQQSEEDVEDEDVDDPHVVDASAVETPSLTFKEWVRSLALVAEVQARQEGDVGNQQYLPKIVDDIIHLMRLIPFCTSVMVPHFNSTRIVGSSAPVESSFNNIKHRVFGNSELPLRVDDFVFKHIQVLDGTMKLCAAERNRVSDTPPPTDSQSHENCESDVLVRALSADPSLQSRHEEVLRPDDQMPVIATPIPVVQAFCAACKDGNYPTGAHKCVYCNVAVHIFPECSLPLSNDEESEGYGQRRMCISCSSTHTREKNSRIELQAVENWRNQGAPPKKRSRSSYLENNSEWLCMDLSDSRQVIPIPLMKNGNKLRPMRKKKERICLSNTCAFDSLLQLACVTYCDSEGMKVAMDRDCLPFFQLVANVIKSGVSQASYHSRAAILMELFPKVHLVGGITQVDCLHSVEVLVRSIYIAHPSLTEKSHCDSLICSRQDRVINIHAYAVSCSVAEIKSLGEKLMHDINETRYSPCHELIRDVEGNGTEHCPGLRSTQLTFPERHIFMELVDPSLSTESGVFPPKIQLCEIPPSIKLGEKMFKLRGVCGYTGDIQQGSVGHYTAYCRRHDDHWECYDDMKDNKEWISASRSVSVALLSYTIS